MRRELMAATRDGFTLLEMTLSITVLLAVFAMAVPLFRSQLRAMGSHAGRLDAQQNVRFAISTIERELRVAGAGVPDRQPIIVQADPYAVTFNADLAARDPASEGGAFGAVYHDPDLPAGATMSLSPSSAITLPLSGVAYPTVSYDRGGTQSAAETISFWVARDSSAGSRGRYALYRRVNALPIDTVARGLVLDPATPPFTYLTADSTGVVGPVPLGSLAAFHVAQHDSPADTGRSALTDAIRLVRVHLRGAFVERNGASSMRSADATVRLRNAGLLNRAACGDAPVFGSTVTAAYDGAATRQVIIAWSHGIDDGAGERDVERYVIYRRAAAASAFAEPIASVPAGQPTYRFSDTRITSGEQLVYAVAAADCGAQLSPLAVTTAVTVP